MLSLPEFALPRLLLVTALACVSCGQMDPPTIDLGETELRLESGLYSDTLAVSEIESLTLEESFPGQRKKTNGFDAGSLLRGSFEIEGEPARLYVDAAQPPFVRFEHGGTAFWVNGPEPAVTRTLHEDLAARLGD